MWCSHFQKRSVECSTRRTSMRAFTLIELLVVIAIISLLSTVVLSSLKTAREQAKDSAIKSGAIELRKIMQQEFSDTGSYAAIKSGGSWKARGTDCSSASFSGTYGVQARKVCDAIMANYPADVGCTANCVYFNSTNPNSNDQFTIMAYMPAESAKAGSSRYLCFGSSGRTSIGPTSSWTNPGCYANP